MEGRAPKAGKSRGVFPALPLGSVKAPERSQVDLEGQDRARENVTTVASGLYPLGVKAARVSAWLDGWIDR